MSEPKLCCNCIHCARWKKSTGVECHCDLDDKYLGYLQVMDEENDCKKWEKETKWDLQREHDKQIRADAIDEFVKSIEKNQTMQDNYFDAPRFEMSVDMTDILKIAEWLKGGAE